jgi:hypothetical protein
VVTPGAAEAQKLRKASKNEDRKESASSHEIEGISPVGRHHQAGNDGLGIQPGKIKHVWLIIFENKRYGETFTGLSNNPRSRWSSMTVDSERRERTTLRARSRPQPAIHDARFPNQLEQLLVMDPSRGLAIKASCCTRSKQDTTQHPRSLDQMPIETPLVYASNAHRSPACSTDL